VGGAEAGRRLLPPLLAQAQVPGLFFSAAQKKPNVKHLLCTSTRLAGVARSLAVAQRLNAFIS
jgi:hypothetical protein